MKKLFMSLFVIGLLYGCAVEPSEEMAILNSKVYSIKKENPYAGKILEDSLGNIMHDVARQRTKFVLFRSYKSISERMLSLSDDIENGVYKTNIKDISSVTGSEIKIHYIQQDKLPINIYIVEIDGREYIYNLIGDRLTIIAK